MIKKFLESLGFNDKETKIYLVLAEIGRKPASIIANKCGFDRITTYKSAKKLVQKGFLKIYYENNIQSFGIDNFENLKLYIEEKKSNFENLSKDYETTKNLLKALKGEEDIIPKLEIFEGEIGIKRFFKDIIHEIKSENIHQIRMLTSNTFSERLGEIELSKYISDFYNDLKENKIDLEIFEASGNLIPERLNRITEETFDLRKLPAARGTTHIFIAGHTVYLACYKDSQIGLKIKQNEISQMFHFIFDMLDIKKISPPIVQLKNFKRID